MAITNTEQITDPLKLFIRRLSRHHPSGVDGTDVLNRLGVPLRPTIVVGVGLIERDALH